MPYWGQHRWGEKKWGWGELPAAAELQRRVLSDNHPWFRRLQLLNPWREAEWQIWTVDPDTLADETQLPHIAGGLRESRWEDEARQHEVLSFQVLDAAEYRTGGVYAALAVAGTLLRLYWQVRSTYGEVTLGTGLYRVTRGPDAGDDERGTQEMTIECEGWLDQPLRDLMLNGNNPLGDAITLQEHMLPLGCPIVWNVNTYASLVAAIVFYAAGLRLRVPEPWRTLNWWGTSSPTPTEPPPPPPEPPPPAPPGESNLTATVGVGPNTTNRGDLTHFDITWTYSGDDATGGDAIFIGPDGLTLAQASEAAASLPPGDPRLVSTGGFTSLGAGIDIALDFGVGVAARWWYWHRVHGALDTAALVALLG